MKDPRLLLTHILENIDSAMRNLEDISFNQFLKDKMIQDAVVREIEIIGEASKNLQSNLKEKYPHIPWKQMARMRDKIVHNYFEIEFKVVWETVKEDLPNLRKKVLDIFEDLNSK